MLRLYCIYITYTYDLWGGVGGVTGYIGGVFGGRGEKEANGFVLKIISQKLKYKSYT